MCKSKPYPKPAVVGTPGDPANTVDRKAGDAVMASGLRRRSIAQESGTLLGQAPASSPKLGA